ncbi:hypothetical protein JCM1840_006963 [Sporobolomyces johnsonii]
MSLLRRALRSVGLRIGKDRYLAGVDLEGNSFYEKPNPEKPDEWRKTKRYVEYAVTRPLSDYNFNTIPVQWSSWLRRTRRDPPTLLELEQDHLRQLRLQANVRRLELAYAEEKLRLAAANKAALLPPASSPAAANKADEEERAAPPADGLPAKDVGIGPREAKIGREIWTGEERSTGGSSAARADGLPAKDVGIGHREAKIGREIWTGEEGHPLQMPAASKKPKEGGEAPESPEEAAKRRRDEDREAARRRREEFARSAPPTGNPSDSFKPEGRSPQPARRR